MLTIKSFQTVKWTEHEANYPSPLSQQVDYTERYLHASCTFLWTAATT